MGGSPAAMRSPAGSAPMAAISLRLTATAIQPICQGFMISGKSVLSCSISVVATR